MIATMLRNRNDVSRKRGIPQRRMKSLPFSMTTHQYMAPVPTTKKPRTRTSPKIDVHTGSRMPIMYGRSTLVIASTLCGSHFSQGQNQFQPGPRRKVPMTMSDTQRMWNPKTKVISSILRSLNV